MGSGKVVGANRVEVIADVCGLAMILHDQHLAVSTLSVLREASSRK